MSARPFHLALPVPDLAKARSFYKDILGCEEGRSDTHWVDFNFFGHQLVFHRCNTSSLPTTSNPVDAHQIPVPHAGVVLEKKAWHRLAKRLQTHAIPFIVQPYQRFLGQPGEQGTFFICDFNKIHLEFKYFQHDHMLFET